MDNQECINKLCLDIVELIESYQHDLQPYEIGHALIAAATSMMLYTAPNTLVAFKTILTSVEIGINDHESNLGETNE